MRTCLLDCLHAAALPCAPAATTPSLPPSTAGRNPCPPPIRRLQPLTLREELLVHLPSPLRGEAQRARRVGDVGGVHQQLQAGRVAQRVGYQRSTSSSRPARAARSPTAPSPWTRCQAEATPAARKPHDGQHAQRTQRTHLQRDHALVWGPRQQVWPPQAQAGGEVLHAVVVPRHVGGEDDADDEAAQVAEVLGWQPAAVRERRGRVGACTGVQGRGRKSDGAAQVPCCLQLAACSSSAEGHTARAGCRGRSAQEIGIAEHARMFASA